MRMFAPGLDDRLSFRTTREIEPSRQCTGTAWARHIMRADYVATRIRGCQYCEFDLHFASTT